jgi:hypothetical protein
MQISPVKRAICAGPLVDAYYKQGGDRELVALLALGRPR